MKVIPLGTSSGKPTLRRNVSALAVAREGEWLLFDCGEGAQMQLMRAGLSASRLAGIFITHLHGDHFNGLSGLLSTMGLDRRTRPLALAGPEGIREYIDTLSRLKILWVNYPLDLSVISRPGPHATLQVQAQSCFAGEAEVEPFVRRNSPPRDAQQDAAPGVVIYETDDYVVYSGPMDHRIFAVGYRVEERPRPGRFNLERAREFGVPEGPLFGRLQSGFDVQLADGRVIHPSDVLGPERPGRSVAYCTDTRPFAGAVELARGVDVLVHEATYTQDMAEEADAYGHSTAAQAARVALEAGARHLVITHFSSRYADPTPLLEEARKVFPNTTMAQDLVPIEV